MIFNAEEIIVLVKKEAGATLGIDANSSINEETIISQLFDSFSLANLMINIETKLSVEVASEEFFDATIVTIGDLADFFIKQKEAKR